MISLAELTRLIDGELKGDPEFPVSRVNSLARARQNEISFCVKETLPVPGTEAGALIVKTGSRIAFPNLVYTAEPYAAFAILLEYFYPRQRFNTGIDPRASVSERAVIGDSVSVGCFSHIGDHSVIGDHTEIHSGVTIYPHVTIGTHCLIYANVVIREGVEIGDHVVIQPGAVIGADGFGFTRTADGTPVKIPQKGKVIIGNHCEIGANTCIDRSTIEETVLKDSVKLDNLVQIGHNVKIGKGTAISGLSGVAGSVEIGENVIVAGQVGISDHVTIADGVIMVAGTGVSGNVKNKSIIAGRPHQDFNSWKRSQVIIRNLEQYLDRLKRLEKKMEDV
ncbi:MAG: UDP-3-O-(3-hydroxymyristoyl)glucosamine N-acyltransferase [Candidatus Omnitrophota bacterium]